MESKKKDSRTFKKESMLVPKLDLKESSMLRITKRQLLKEKTDRQLIPKNSRGAEVSGDDSEDEVDGEDYEMRREIIGKKVRAASDADADADADDSAVDKTSALKALADNFTVGATDQQSDIESTGEGSTMARKSGDTDLSGLSESSAAQRDTKKSENPVTLPPDMYLVESIKGDRMLKTGNREFLIKWQGYEDKRDLTWEPEKTLLESAPGLLSNYYDKIGGRTMVGKKRKQGRASNAADSISTDKLSSVKKPKVESESAIEKTKIASNKGKELDAGIPKKDKPGMGADDGKKPDPKTPPPKKRRDHPAKAKTVEATLGDNNAPKTVTGIVRAGGVSFGMGLDPMNETGPNEALSLMKEVEKMDRMRPLNTKSTSQGFTLINEPDERIATHSDDDIPKKRPGCPFEVQDQLALSTDDGMPGKDIDNKVIGHPSKRSGQASSAEKLDPFAEGIAKKGAGGTVKSKASAAGQLNQGLAETVVKKGLGRPAKSGGSTAYSAAMAALNDIPAKRGPGRPAKAKGPRCFEKESEDEDENRESSAPG